MSWSNGLTGHDVSQTIVPIAGQILTFVNVSFALLLIFVSSLKKKKRRPAESSYTLHTQEIHITSNWIPACYEELPEVYKEAIFRL